MEQKSENSYTRITIPLFFILLLKLGSMAGFGMPEKKQVPKELPVRKPTEEISPDAGHQVKNLTEEELRTYLYKLGFKQIDNAPLYDLRRMFLAFHYDQLLTDVHNSTGVPKAVLFAYLIIEATVQGIETPLLQHHWNPGGIKYKGIANKTMHYDDCYDSNGRPMLCAFESASSYAEAVKIWSSVFNAPRYTSCKNKPIGDTCKCLQDAGYHSSNSWRNRYRIAKDYINYTQKLPNARREYP